MAPQGLSALDDAGRGGAALGPCQFSPDRLPGHLLEPQLAILDETDSGLDIDALRIVANGINSLRSDKRAFILVTHYQRLLDHVVPDRVHILSGGRIACTGGPALARTLEKRGYGWIEEQARAEAGRPA